MHKLALPAMILTLCLPTVSRAETTQTTNIVTLPPAAMQALPKTDDEMRQLCSTAQNGQNATGYQPDAAVCARLAEEDKRAAANHDERTITTGHPVKPAQPVEPVKPVQ